MLTYHYKPTKQFTITSMKQVTLCTWQVTLHTWRDMTRDMTWHVTWHYTHVTHFSDISLTMKQLERANTSVAFTARSDSSDIESCSNTERTAPTSSQNGTAPSRREPPRFRTGAVCATSSQQYLRTARRECVQHLAMLVFMCAWHIITIQCTFVYICVHSFQIMQRRKFKCVPWCR